MLYDDLEEGGEKEEEMEKGKEKEKNLYSAPSRGLLRGAPDSSLAKSTILSLIKNASVRIPGSGVVPGEPFQTTGPTTEKSGFCIVAVRANGTK